MILRQPSISIGTRCRGNLPDSRAKKKPGVIAGIPLAPKFLLPVTGVNPFRGFIRPALGEVRVAPRDREALVSP